MIIRLVGKNKAEIRKAIHEVEENGLLIKKCIEKHIEEYNQGDMLVMMFDCEIQYGNWTEVEKKYLNKKELINLLAPIIGVSKIELNKEISKNDIPYWRIGNKEAQFLIRISNLEAKYPFKLFGENMIYAY